MSATIFMDVALFRQRFELCLEDFFKRKEQALVVLTSDQVLQEWLHEAERLGRAGGKRVRPLLLVLGYLLEGGTNERAVLKASVALELFHFFALVHDDIMDGGLERHGVPTAHVRIASRLQDLGRQKNTTLVATSQAILIGDLLFSWSVEALSCAEDFSLEARAAAMRFFFQMSDEVMVGQMLDVDLTTRTQASEAEMYQKMLLKTAGYTFIRPLQIGMALAESGVRHAAFAESFGAAFGVAFQIQDDILDVFGSMEETGKTPLSDIRDGQHSLLTQWVMERGSLEDRERLLAIWGSVIISEEAVEEIRTIFIRSGALSSALKVCQQRIMEAQTVLAKTEMSEAIRSIFEGLFTRAMKISWLAELEYLS